MISIYENSALKDCSKLIKDTRQYLKILPEAENGEKLKDSIFFMAIYESYKNDYLNNEKERYDCSLKKFNELKQLGINSDINLLEKNLKNIIIDSVYKNKEGLKNELKFINSYFGFDSGKNNYNIVKIKKSLSKLVKEYQKENKLDDYVVKIDDILDIDEKDEINGIKKINENNVNIIIVKTADNSNNIEDEFVLSQKQIISEKENLIKQIKKLGNDFILSGSKNKNINKQQDYLYE